jgi:hypothetical protein
MEWERAAWVGGLALMSAGVAGGVAIAASKQTAPTVGPGVLPPRLPTPAPTTPITVIRPPKVPPITTTTTTTAPVINYKNVILQTMPVPAGAKSASLFDLQDVVMQNPTQLTIQLPPGATWSSANPVPKYPWPSSISDVVFHTSGDSPWVLTFSGTVGNSDDVLTIRWIDASGSLQESQLTLIAASNFVKAPVNPVVPAPIADQKTLTLQPGASSGFTSAPWVTTVGMKSPTQLTIQLPPGGTWNGNGNALQGGPLGLNLTSVYPGGSITNVVATLSGTTPISFLFSGVVGKVSYVLTLNWMDSNFRSQQAQISLMATA